MAKDQTKATTRITSDMIKADNVIKKSEKKT